MTAKNKCYFSFIEIQRFFTIVFKCLRNFVCFCHYYYYYYCMYIAKRGKLRPTEHFRPACESVGPK